MNDIEKKEYIKKVWRVSSGKKITEMIKRYWKLKNVDLITEAEKIFEISEPVTPTSGD